MPQLFYSRGKFNEDLMSNYVLALPLLARFVHPVVFPFAVICFSWLVQVSERACCAVLLLQIVCIKLRITPGHIKRSVSKHLLEIEQIAAVPDILPREVATEGVKDSPSFFDSDFLEQGLEVSL